MSIEHRSDPGPAQSLPVYPACAFTAVDGANLGDPLTIAEDLIAGDVYQLSPFSERCRLSVCAQPGAPSLRIARQTEAGNVGAEVHLDCCVTFMSPDGTVVEALILVELGGDGETIAHIHIFPLAEMQQRTDYAIVSIDRRAARTRFAETACVSFTRGTRITMANGAQIPVEGLNVGDRVLTRDHGVQQIRWIGRQTVRALGAFAPIRIAEGTLNNASDLVVSPNHRLFVYQRQDRLGAGRREVLVKAKYLLNGTTVTRTSGGFVDYFQMLFDRHEIIYAEGIAAETLLVDDTTRAALPEDISRNLTRDAPRRVMELREAQVDARVAADLFRQASVG